MAKVQIEKAKAENTVKDKTCGIIMPIADHADYPKGHWTDVLEILKQAVGVADFNAELVSSNSAVGLIQDRIVTNIYNNEIVICDVSSKNPNVMFELGMRLAFDKPTIIIKDDKTGYSFDIGGIEHITYPSSLRFADIVDFKKDLVARIEATYNKSQEEPEYSPFLKSFGRTIKPSTITPTEIPENQFLSDQIAELTRLVYSMIRSNEDSIYGRFKTTPNSYRIKKDFVGNVVEDILFKNRELNEGELHRMINTELFANGIKVPDDYVSALIRKNKKMMADTLFD
ncbi:MAG: hypothetical protein RR796_04940 [Victivallaceae bacterium]